MQLTSLVVCGIVAVLGCNSSGTASPSAASPALPIAHAPAPPPQQALTGTFAECDGDCRFDFRELEAPTPRVTQRYCRDTVPSCITFEGRLAPAGRAQLDGAVPEIRAAHPLFASISHALTTCVSNELVQIGADCTPREALSPRPYSRP